MTVDGTKNQRAWRVWGICWYVTVAIALVIFLLALVDRAVNGGPSETGVISALDILMVLAGLLMPAVLVGLLLGILVVTLLSRYTQVPQVLTGLLGFAITPLLVFGTVRVLEIF